MLTRFLHCSASALLLGVSSLAVLAGTFPPQGIVAADACPLCADLFNLVGVDQPPGSDPRIYLLQQTGQIRRVNVDTGETELYLNIDATAGGTEPPFGFLRTGEGGLLGFTFDPDFESNGLLYISYTDANRDTVIARFSTTGGANSVVDPNSALVILRVDQDRSNHNGGHLAFGLDGYLYIGLGDGGENGDGCRRSQTIAPDDLMTLPQCAVDKSFVGPGANADSLALLGSLLRIDVHASTPSGSNELCSSNDDGSANYAIPTDNPFAGNSMYPGACDEIYAFGLRNPWRFSFDVSTGDAYIGDVGEWTYEEINYAPFGTLAARNFGWSCEEGPPVQPRSVRGVCLQGFPLTYPVLTCTHPTCLAIVGGVLYRGPITRLQGMYVYADWNEGALRVAMQEGPNQFGPQPVDGNSWLPIGASINSFGTNREGDLFVAAGQGRFYVVRDDLLVADGFE